MCCRNLQLHCNFNTHCISPNKDFATSPTNMDAVITLLFCPTISTGDQSGADRCSFMRLHPFPIPKLCFVLTSMSFLKTQKRMHTLTHKQSLKDGLQFKEETHPTSNSLAHSASGSIRAICMPSHIGILYKQTYKFAYIITHLYLNVCTKKCHLKY